MPAAAAILGSQLRPIALALCVALAFTTEGVFGQQDTSVALSGQVDLLRLVDLSAQRLGMDVEYDAAALKAMNVTLRLEDPLADDELWALTNQLLAARGFASIHPSFGSEADAPNEQRPTGREVLSIVKLTDAGGLARIERDLPLTTRAGYVSVWLEIHNRPLKDISDALKLLLSKPGGVMQELPSQSAVVISDLRPRVDRIVEILRAMDAPGEASVIETINARHVPATGLVALVTAAAVSSNALASRSLHGTLTAVPDSSAIVLVAPGHEVPRWQELIERFDQPANVETRSYATGYLALNEVAALIDETARDSGPRGSGDRFRVVSDRLGGLLIVTATPAEHSQIATLIDRLNAMPAEARRPVRAFPIRNRSVGEIVEVLTKMLEAGVLEGAQFTVAPSSGEALGPSRIAPDLLQRSSPTSAVPAGASPNPGSTTAPSSNVSADDPAGRRGSDRSTDQPKATGLTITADEGTNTLIAVGEPRRLAQLEELLRAIDVRQPQVMVEVLVVSLTEGDTLDLGVELEKIEISGDTVITLSSLFGLLPRGATSPTGKGFSGLILNPGDFRILIRALQTLNEGRALNMPRVLVNNNQQANLDAVVQQPFVSTNASDTVATTSFGGFENAGTTITVKPQIAKGDHLVLEYSVSLSAFVGESSDPGIPPPRQQNNLQSVVTIPDGYTVVVGGIEVETKADAVTQVPLLGDIPWIGEAFKSRSRSSSRSRFFVFIRPTVLRQEGFEDLKYLSDVAAVAADVDDGFPEVLPRIIR